MTTGHKTEHILLTKHNFFIFSFFFYHRYQTSFPLPDNISQSRIKKKVFFSSYLTKLQIFLFFRTDFISYIYNDG